MPTQEHTPSLSLIVDHLAGAGGRYGVRKLREQLQYAGVDFEEADDLATAHGRELLVTGHPAAPAVATLLDHANVRPPGAPESLLIHRTSWRGQPAWIVTGADARGLMYAMLEVADRVGWAADPAQPLSEVQPARESPEVRERSISIYTMHRRTLEERLHDETYWAHYLDTLARNRFNTFALLFAYESAGYMAPPYPYFFTVPGFPEVRALGYTPERQQRNLKALNRLVAVVHERGLDFTLGIWDHIYRGGVQTGGVQEGSNTMLPWRVIGLTGETLVPYSVAALTELLQRVPNLNTIQFRMHGESGLTREEMDRFWDQIYDVIVTHAPGIRFDARAKGFPDHLINLALEKDVNIRITTKYWMEQMGLPFHPTHVHPQNQHDRRHGYADLLRYPQRYSMLWRLWNGGTNRVLLWGDPDYVRRFVESTHLYNGDGFDVNEPLATKMAAHDHDEAPFELLQSPYRFYTWEFERYWHFFQLFGRLGYNPQTSPEVWEREFARRFGNAAEAIMRGLHHASRVLPRVVAYTYPYHLFPTTRGWVGKERMDDLPTYAAALPSDTAQFLSIAEEAALRLRGGESARVRPQDSSAWFDRTADEIFAYAAEAEAQVGKEADAEFISTLTDIKILAHLARYHTRRVHAGVHWALYHQSRDLHALDAAIAYEREAVDAWTALVAAADAVYNDDLKMGLEAAGLSGHWRDELTALRAGLAELESRRDSYEPPAPQDAPWIAYVPVRRSFPAEEITIRATVNAEQTVTDVRLCYGSDESDTTCTAMASDGTWRYERTIPGAAVRPGLTYHIEATDAAGHSAVTDAIEVTVTDDREPPLIEHAPVAGAPAGEPLRIRATVDDAAGVKWVRLRYRSVTQYEDYPTLEMHHAGAPGLYEAVVPGAALDSQWDFMYYIEAMDEAGNGTIYPSLETTTPYTVVPLERS